MKLISPYDSVYLKLQNMSAINNAITRYIVTDYEYIRPKQSKQIKKIENLNPVILYGISSIEKDIPGFNHPLINLNEKWIAVDARSLVKADSSNVSYTVRDENGFNFLLQKLIMSGLWCAGKENDLYALKFPHFAYGTWMSDNLAKRFGLDLNDQIKIKIVSLIYYSHLFKDEFDHEDFGKLLIRLKEEIVSTELIVEVYEQTKELYGSVNGFCEACYKATNNIKLKGFDSNVLINLVANNWTIGSVGKESVILSLEHPPTWLALVYSSIVLKSYSKCYISSLIDKINKRGKGEEFIKSYVYLARHYLEDI